MKTLIAKYAPLPLTSLTQQFMVEIVEPVHLIPQIIQTPFTEIQEMGEKEALKIAVLEYFHDMMQAALKDVAPDDKKWEHMPVIGDVELIECNLLEPKTPRQLKLNKWGI